MLSLAPSKHVFFIILYSIHIEIVIKITRHSFPISLFTCTVLIANKYDFYTIIFDFIASIKHHIENLEHLISLFLKSSSAIKH